MNRIEKEKKKNSTTHVRILFSDGIRISKKNNVPRCFFGLSIGIFDIFLLLSRNFFLLVFFFPANAIAALAVALVKGIFNENLSVCPKRIFFLLSEHLNMRKKD